MPTYAAGTDVPSDRSRSEIERTVIRYGAEEFAYIASRSVAAIAFVIGDRQIRITLPLPSRDDVAFTRTPTGKPASASAAEAKYEQAVRQKWRALLLVVKAKLEAIESEISTLEQEFAMFMVLPDGSTAGDHVTPWTDQAYALGTVPPLLQIEP